MSGFVGVINIGGASADSASPKNWNAVEEEQSPPRRHSLPTWHDQPRPRDTRDTKSEEKKPGSGLPGMAMPHVVERPHQERASSATLVRSPGMRKLHRGTRLVSSHATRVAVVGHGGLRRLGAWNDGDCDVDEEQDDHDEGCGRILVRSNRTLDPGVETGPHLEPDEPNKPDRGAEGEPAHDRKEEISRLAGVPTQAQAQAPPLLEGKDMADMADCFHRNPPRSARSARSGDLTERGPGTFRHLLRAAADRRDAEALVALGLLWEQGHGSSRSSLRRTKNALAAYVAAARLSVSRHTDDDVALRQRTAISQAQYFVARSLDDKWLAFGFAARDAVQACDWYRAAATNGDAAAQFWLGTHLEGPSPCPCEHKPNVTKALRWFEAAAAGHDMARRAVIRLHERIAQEHLARARELAHPA